MGVDRQPEQDDGRLGWDSVIIVVSVAALALLLRWAGLI